MTIDIAVKRKHRSPNTRSYRVNIPRRSAPFQVYTPEDESVSLWKFPHPETDVVLRKAYKANDVFSLVIPKLKDKAFEAELFRFKKVLELYSQMPGKKVHNPMQIFVGSLCKGPKYAEYLDDLMKYSLRLSTCEVFSLNFDSYEDKEAEEISHIDCIFPAHHLIPFDTGEDISDYDWSDIPVSIDEEFIERFKDKTREFIVGTNIVPPELDSLDLLRLMGSATNFSLEEGKRVPKSILKAKDPTLEYERGPFQFSVTSTFKQPHESRTIVVPTPKTLNSLMILEKQLEHVLDVPSNDFYVKDFSFLERWLTGDCKYHFLMEDQKKCGLTVPRELLAAMFDVCQECYPDWDFDLFRSGFSQPVLHTSGGRKFTPKRGVGLGMMNGAISAMTSIIFEIFNEDREDIHLEGRFFNDDQVIRYVPRLISGEFQTFEDELELAQDWEAHMKQYRLIVSESKPFLCESGVYLEVYGKDFPIDTMKRTQYLGNLFDCLRYKSLSRRKNHVNMIFSCLPDEYLKLAEFCLREIQTLSGFEFKPEEVNLPFELGGWVSFYEDGQNTVFRDFTRAPYNYGNEIYLMLLKCKQPRMDRRVIRKLPNYKAIKRSIESWIDTELAFDYYSKALKSLEFPSRHPKDVSCIWSNYDRIRKEVYNGKNLPVLTDKDILALFWTMTIERETLFMPPRINKDLYVSLERGDEMEDFQLPPQDKERLLMTYQFQKDVRFS